MIETCAGSVSGTTVRAFVKRTPRSASAESAGMSRGVSRSARRVSIVTSRTFGGAADGAGAGA